MKQTFKKLFLITLLAQVTFSLSSCYPTGPAADPYYIPESRQKENYYYIPSASNTPLLSKQGDLNLSILRSAASKLAGSEVQASFMPAKHIGIMGGYSFAGTQGDNKYVKYHRFEAGAGYVTSLSKNFHFETYGGIGNGKILNMHATGTSKINLTHFFLQPAISISKKENIQFAFVSKFSGVSFKVDTAFSTDRESFSAGQVKSLYDKPFHIIWEPGFVFRAGWKNFQFHAGYTFSTDITNSNTYKPDGNFAAGICIRLNTIEKK